MMLVKIRKTFVTNFQKHFFKRDWPYIEKKVITIAIFGEAESLPILVTARKNLI